MPPIKPFFFKLSLFLFGMTSLVPILHILIINSGNNKKNNLEHILLNINNNSLHFFFQHYYPSLKMVLSTQTKCYVCNKDRLGYLRVNS
jgi:hypothetical protein